MEYFVRKNASTHHRKSRNARSMMFWSNWRYCATLR